MRSMMQKDDTECHDFATTSHARPRVAAGFAFHFLVPAPSYKRVSFFFSTEYHRAAAFIGFSGWIIIRHLLPDTAKPV